MQKEIWKDIPDFEGKYAISNMGRVYSYKSKRTLAPGLTGQRKNYELVTLYKDKKKFNCRVHRLVALLFVPNPDPEYLTDVNHIDENTRNNRADNLEWVTKTYNNQWSKGQYIQQKTLDGEVVNTFPSMQEAARATGYDYSAINRHSVNHKPYKNFIWEKIDNPRKI